MTYKQHASSRTPILTFLDDSNKDFALQVVDESIKLDKVWSFIKNNSHNFEYSVFNRYSFKVENIKAGDKYNGVITLDINDWSGAYSCTPYTNKDKSGAFMLKKRKVVYSLP